VHRVDERLGAWEGDGRILGEVWRHDQDQLAVDIQGPHAADRPVIRTTRERIGAGE